MGYGRAAINHRCDFNYYDEDGDPETHHGCLYKAKPDEASSPSNRHEFLYKHDAIFLNYKVPKDRTKHKLKQINRKIKNLRKLLNIQPIRQRNNHVHSFYKKNCEILRINPRLRF